MQMLIVVVINTFHDMLKKNNKFPFLHRYADPVTGKAKTINLALKDTLARSSAGDLKEFLYAALEQYEIDINNIVAVVTDNAANMCKLVQDMDEVKF